MVFPVASYNICETSVKSDILAVSFTRRHLAARHRPDPHALGMSLVHFSRGDFEDIRIWEGNEQTLRATLCSKAASVHCVQAMRPKIFQDMARAHRLYVDVAADDGVGLQRRI